MSQRKARAISHKGKVYYDVASTARLLRTTAARIRQLMGAGDLKWTQLRRGGRLVIPAEYIVEFKRRLSRP